MQPAAAAVYIRTLTVVRSCLRITRGDVQPEAAALEQPRPLPYFPYLARDYTRVTLQLQLVI